MEHTGCGRVSPFANMFGMLKGRVLKRRLLEPSEAHLGQSKKSGRFYFQEQTD